MPAKRRAAGQASRNKTTRRAPQGKRGLKADVVITDEVPAEVLDAAADHPGVLAAHAGQVTPEECGHPAGRRDAKNLAFCRACGTGGLTPPPAKRR